MIGPGGHGPLLALKVSKHVLGAARNFPAWLSEGFRAWKLQTLFTSLHSLKNSSDNSLTFWGFPTRKRTANMTFLLVSSMNTNKVYIYIYVCAWNLDRILTATTRTPVSWYFMCRVARLTWISSEWDTRTVPHTSRFQHCITLARFGKATVGQQPRISKPMLCQAGCHTSSGSLPGRAAASTKSWAKASAAVVAWGVASPRNVPVISYAMLYSLAD